MQAFFRGWRRKCGSGFLVVAILFFAAWGASTRFCVIVECDNGDRQYHVHSYGNEFGIWWYKPNSENRRRKIYWYASWTDYSLWESIAMRFEIEREVLSGRFEGCVFCVEDVERMMPTDFMDLTFPYWGAVLPFTLLSACLLLWPQCKHSI
jgi:hypothetical protein